MKLDMICWRKPSATGKADQITTQKFIEFATQKGCEIRLFSLELCSSRLLPVIEKDSTETCSTDGMHLFVLKFPLWMVPINCIFGVWLRRPIQVAMTSNWLVSKVFSKFFDQHGCGDILYCHTFRPSLWLDFSDPKLSYQRKCLALQISHTINYRRLTRFGGLSWPWRIAYGIEQWLCAKFEPEICGAYDAINLINKEEADNLRLQISREAQAAPIYSIGHGVDIDGLSKVAEEPCFDFCFLANFAPATNKAALTWLLDEIWPRLLKINEGFTLVLAGRNFPQSLEKRLPGGVTFIGEVDSAHAAIRSARCFLNPVLACAGMQNKILTALGAGVSVVATENSVLGMNIPAELLAGVSNDSESFAKLAADEVLLKTGSNVDHFKVEYVSEYWNWETLHRQFFLEFIGASKLDGLVKA